MTVIYISAKKIFKHDGIPLFVIKSQKKVKIRCILSLSKEQGGKHNVCDAYYKG